MTLLIELAGLIILVTFIFVPAWEFKGIFAKLRGQSRDEGGDNDTTGARRE
jgi:hypothetical protein